MGSTRLSVLVYKSLTFHHTTQGCSAAIQCINGNLGFGRLCQILPPGMELVIMLLRIPIIPLLLCTEETYHLRDSLVRLCVLLLRMQLFMLIGMRTALTLHKIK